MNHIVINEQSKCPKCKKQFSGACVSVLEFIVCSSCYYERYVNEIEPKIIEMVREYFQPERLNPKAQCKHEWGSEEYSDSSQPFYKCNKCGIEMR